MGPSQPMDLIDLDASEQNSRCCIRWASRQLGNCLSHVCFGRTPSRTNKNYVFSQQKKVKMYTMIHFLTFLLRKASGFPQVTKNPTNHGNLSETRSKNLNEHRCMYSQAHSNRENSVSLGENVSSQTCS